MSGLRKRVRELIDAAVDDGLYFGDKRDGLVDDILATVAVLSSKDEPLDVERLTTAIRNLYDHPDYIEADGIDNGFAVVAEAIAREYEALR